MFVVQAHQFPFLCSFLYKGKIFGGSEKKREMFAYTKAMA